MNNFQVFVSHSHKDKELAGTIKEELELKFGVGVFVAHEDVRPTEEWQKMILKMLRECEVFATILTRDFVNSDWTDQETGFAVALEKKIVPINIDVNPYGFINKYQALKWRTDDPTDSIRKLVRILVEQGVIATHRLIESFAKSISFDDAGFKSELLEVVEKFSQEQINQIAKATLENNQIFDSFKAQPHLRALFSKYRDVIKPEDIRRLIQVGITLLTD